VTTNEYIERAKALSGNAEKVYRKKKTKISTHYLRVMKTLSIISPILLAVGAQKTNLRFGLAMCKGVHAT